MFSDDTEKRRVVVIVTRTQDKEAVRVWRDELSKLGCDAVLIEPDELIDYMRDRKPLDGVMLDDVCPFNTPEMRNLAAVLTHIRPEPKIAFLVAEYDDFHDLQHLLNSNGRIVVHHDGQPMMEGVYEHLAGANKCPEPPVKLLH